MKTHLRFESEGPADSSVPIFSNSQEHASDERQDVKDEDALVNDDNGSDSDEAPETVTTAKAISKANVASEQAARALKAQQEKQRKKNQQRADRIAEQQAEKRKRYELQAQKLARRQDRKIRLRQPEYDSPPLVPLDIRLRQPECSSPPRALLDIDVHNLPALLPTSLLETVDDRRPLTPPPSRAGKTAKELRKEKLRRHIKFLEHGEKPVKDVKKGLVNVSVLSQQNMLLAPKVNRNTKGIREHWLKGRQLNKAGKKGRDQWMKSKMERRPAGCGFLRDGDD